MAPPAITGPRIGRGIDMPSGLQPQDACYKPSTPREPSSTPRHISASRTAAHAAKDSRNAMRESADHAIPHNAEESVKAGETPSQIKSLGSDAVHHPAIQRQHERECKEICHS